MILRIIAYCISIVLIIMILITERNKSTKKDVDYLNALNRQYRQAKSKIENRDKFIAQQQNELDETKAKYMKLRTFELMVENLVNGKRKPEEIIDRIKKELSSVQR